MNLKKIEIQGFKSFANKIEINFEEGITGIVGPNGSGKSNISDSIRWVLGEQSAKTLRGSKMEDIIFSGTTSRKPLGMAEVSITLDNSSKALPIDYDEVRITRRTYRSGESEYYINKSSCRLKDVRELLMDTGIGKDGYSIIGQGKIDEILNNKSEDRRQIFEEAAGIVKYKTRKCEAEKKLSSTQENLLRVLDILKELESQLQPLRKQSDKAKKYKVLKEKLLKLEVSLFIKEIDKIDEELKHIYSQINVLKKSAEEQKKEKQIHVNRLEKLKNSINQYDIQISNKQEEYYNIQKNIENIEGQINLKKEKANNNASNIERIKQEIKQIEKTQEDMLIKLEEKTLAFENICDNLNYIKDNINNEKNKHGELYNENFQKEKEVEDWKSLIIEDINKISDKKSEAKSLNTLLDTMEERLYQVQLDNNKYKESILSKKEELKNSKADLQELKDQIIDMENTIKEKVNKKEKLLNKLNDVSSKINKLQNQLTNKKARKNIIEDMEKEHEGFNSSVKNILKACNNNKELGKGIYGAVADLMQVPKGYEISIETALGPTLQYIVSEEENDGKRLIEYLKKYNLGRITILPLTTIQERYINNKELDIISSFKDVQIAFNIIKFDNKFNNIFSSLLSRVLIVPNLNEGIKIAKLLKYKFKIVTLDGNVLNIGGSLTGGSNSKKTNSILSRKRELDDLISEIKIIKEKLDKEMKIYTEIDKQVKCLTTDIQKSNESLQENRIKLASLNSNLEQCEKEKNQLETAHNHTKNEINQIQSTKQETINRYKAIESEINYIEEEVNRTEAKINYNQNDLRQKKEKLNDLNNILTDYKVRLATIEEQKKTFSKDIEGLQESIKQNGNSLENKEKQLQELSAIEISNKNDANILSSKLNKLTLKLKTYENELREFRSNKELEEKQESEIKKLLEQVESVLLDLQDGIYKLDVKRTRLEMQQQNYYTKLSEEYELTYNLALNIKEEITDISNTNKEITSIKTQIKNLGSINLDSIDEYEKINDRYNFLNVQQEDLNKAKQSLTKVIDDMEKTMKKQFIDQLNIIRENFNTVFAKLFGGGKTNLILNDESNPLECGIDIIAQPPGKKLQALSLLSGGERALTAISLLFAILLVKPSPFCILDEIEAALDDANVYRYAKFLEDLSKDTQFIVVTHRKGTMESADALYGVTMQDSGISNLVSVKLSDYKDNEVAS